MLNIRQIEGLVVQISGLSGSEYIIPEFLYKRLLAAAIKTIKFDEGWYLKKYEDVKAAVESGIYKNAWEHYIYFGFYENRMPYNILVDEKYYLESNSDVRDAVLNNEIQSGQEHFEIAGYEEGRSPYVGFCLL